MGSDHPLPTALTSPDRSLRPSYRATADELTLHKCLGNWLEAFDRNDPEDRKQATRSLILQSSEFPEVLQWSHCSDYRGRLSQAE